MSTRLTNPGRVTNYEIEELPKVRGRSWRKAWASLSDPFHVHSQAEWESSLEGRDDG